ncbi:helix-turn-helix transcriptional regulator [Streptomyces cavernae]|uniref:helix-turn-helix domain-containing protein n=1 Tax=Streptomyces cavernae TaxID=2259034 RepID=UPI0030B83491
MGDRAVGEWAPLPEGLGREARALAEHCRLLKERTGLSLAALADRTHYSKSSWQRCLNGRQIPPRSALRSLADAAGADAGRLLSLREAVLRAGHRAHRPRSEPPRARWGTGEDVPEYTDPPPAVADVPPVRDVPHGPDGPNVVVVHMPDAQNASAVPNVPEVSCVPPGTGGFDMPARPDVSGGPALGETDATATPFGAAVRRWRFLSVVFLAVLLTVATACLVTLVLDQEDSGCSPVTKTD